MDIKFLAPAQLEIDEAYSYYVSQTKGLGPLFLDELLGVIKSIRAYPEAWPKFSDRTRRCISSGFPYAVIYQIREEVILIVAVPL